MSSNTDAEKIKAFNKNLDSFIGKKVKERRTMLGMSQDKLASYLGITFQQVQKYEKGVNRISASMLYTMSTVLNVSFQWFVDGFKSSNRNALSENSDPTYEADMQSRKESTELLRAYYSMPSATIRKKVVELVKSMSSVAKKAENNNLF